MSVSLQPPRVSSTTLVDRHTHDVFPTWQDLPEVRALYAFLNHHSELDDETLRDLCDVKGERLFGSPPPAQLVADQDTRADVPAGYTCIGSVSKPLYCGVGGRNGASVSGTIANTAAVCDADASCTGFDHRTVSSGRFFFFT
jgi:hypothetical protein